MAVSSPRKDQGTQKPILSLDFAKEMATWVDDKKGIHLRMYHVAERCSYADYILIVSGSSERHIQAIAEEVRYQGKQLGRYPLGAEGMSQSQWVLLDFGEVLLHVFYEPVREYYELDRLWANHRVSPKDGSKLEALALPLPNDDDDDDDE